MLNPLYALISVVYTFYHIKLNLSTIVDIFLSSCVYNQTWGDNMEYDRIAVGRTIKRLRNKKQISQEVLSGLSGIGRSHLAMIESGAKQANFETVWKIAHGLGIKPSKLVAEIENDCKNADE